MLFGLWYLLMCYLALLLWKSVHGQRGKHEHHTRLHSMYYLTHTVECSMFDFERAVFEREKYWSTL